MTAAELIVELQLVPPETEVLVRMFDADTGADAEANAVISYAEPLQWRDEYNNSQPPDCLMLFCTEDRNP